MRAVVQRVKRAEVRSGGALRGAIGKGLLVFVGVQKGDKEEDIEYISKKAGGLRVFEDEGGKMNRDVREAGGSVLLVSQFTLLGDATKGKRPSFDSAEEPGKAKTVYGALVKHLKDSGLDVEEGEFQAMMEVELINDGPVTILLDSRRVF